MTDAEGRQVLLGIAVRAVDEPLRTGRRWLPDMAELSGDLAEPGATFVTLRREGALLGCIGSLVAHRPLGVDVAHNAAAAAFDDPRLPAVTANDLPELDVHVSVLGPLQPLNVASRAELVRALRPGVDGLLVEDARHRATFLPSVWGQLGTPEAFLDALWAKAGLRPGDWHGGLTASRYQVTEIEGQARHWLTTG